MTDSMNNLTSNRASEPTSYAIPAESFKGPALTALPPRYSRRFLPSMPISFRQLRLSRQIASLIRCGEFTFTPTTCLCGAHRDRPLATLDRYNIPNPVVLCEECGLIRSHPRMDDATLNRFYTEYFQRLYQDSESFDSYFEVQRRHGRLIAEHIGFDNKKPPMRVFEIGTGPGGILKAFSESGHETIGYELDEKAAQYGATRHGLKIFSQSMSKLEPYHGTADLIILSHVLEHFANPKGILGECRKLLRNDGLLYIEVPGIQSLLSGQKEIFGTELEHPLNKDFAEYLVSAHLWHFELSTLEPLLIETGFTLVEGDEMVRALFIPREKPATECPWPKTRGAEVLSYLGRLESERRKYDRRHLLSHSVVWGRTLLSWSKHWAKERL